MRETNIKVSAFGLAFTAALLFGVSGAIASDALAEVSPARAAQSRAVVTAAVLLPYAWYRGKLAARASWSLLLLFGASLTAVNVAYYEAVDRIGVGPGMTLQFLAPIAVLLWMRMVEQRSVRRSTWFAAGVSLIGVGFIAEVWRVADIDLIGVGAGLAAAATFAAYLIIGEKLGETMPPSGIMAYGFVISALMWAVLQPMWSFPTDLSPMVWGELVWMGVLGTALPFMLELHSAALCVRRIRRRDRHGRACDRRRCRLDPVLPDDGSLADLRHGLDRPGRRLGSVARRCRGGSAARRRPLTFTCRFLRRFVPLEGNESTQERGKSPVDPLPPGSLGSSDQR